MTSKAAIFWLGLVVVNAFGYTAGAARFQDRAECPKGPDLNPVVKENCMFEGVDEREWDVNGSGDPDIQGFSDRFSYYPGETVVLRILSSSDQYRVDIYRLGYYQGKGARLVGTTTPSVTLPQTQPECFRDPSTLLVDCGNWSPSASFTLADNATSGVYIARLTRTDSLAPSPEGAAWRTDYSQMRKDPKFARPGPDSEPDGREDESGGGRYRRREKARNGLKEPRASHVYFVVKKRAPTTAPSPDKVSDVLFQTSDATYQAYNRYGGSCTYGSYRPEKPGPRSYVASYNRPFENRDYRAINLFLGAEYPAIRFLERNGFDVSYASGQDVHRMPGAVLQSHYKVFLSVGHDEYWSKQQRINVEEARDLGLNLQFWSGNQIFWKIRWEQSRFHSPSSDGFAGSLDSSPELRTMVCYKETQEVHKIDPRADMWTGTFRDGRPINPDGPNPENSVSGLMFAANAWRNDPLIVPRRFSLLPAWRATAVEKLFSQPRFLTNVIYPGNQPVLGGGFIEPWTVIKQGVLGHEWDEDVDNGHRPEGMIRMSETRVDNICYIQNAGSIYDTGSGTHRLVMYKLPKEDTCSEDSKKTARAIVFGTGTVQWSWGLDDHHDNENGLISQTQNGYSTRIGIDLRGPDRNVQQATINVFAMMDNVQPQTLEPGLVQGHPLVSREQERSASTCTISCQRAPDTNKVIAIAVEVHAPPELVIAGVELKLQQRWHPADPDMTAYVIRTEHDPVRGRLWRLVLDQHHQPDEENEELILNQVQCRFITDDLEMSAPSIAVSC